MTFKYWPFVFSLHLDKLNYFELKWNQFSAAKLNKIILIVSKSSTLITFTETLEVANFLQLTKSLNSLSIILTYFNEYRVHSVKLNHLEVSKIWI